MKFYDKNELNSFSIETILRLMPQNIIIEKENGMTDFVASFVFGKIIDGSFYIEYTQGHRDIKLCEQKKAYYDWHIKDLHQGLVKAFLWRQEQAIKYFKNNPV